MLKQKNIHSWVFFCLLDIFSSILYTRVMEILGKLFSSDALVKVMRLFLMHKEEAFDLDDIIECCIASSHLPFLSNGKFSYKYRNEKWIDGGFYNKPYTRFDNVTPTIIPVGINNGIIPRVTGCLSAKYAARNMISKSFKGSEG